MTTPEEVIAKAARAAVTNMRPESAEAIAQAALAHLQAEGMAVVPGWQPIETKPRDHFQVLVWSERLGQVVAFLDVTWAWWPCPAIEPLSSAPTHWRPLRPASPYGKAFQPMGSAEAQSAVANSPSMKAGKEESK